MPQVIRDGGIENISFGNIMESVYKHTEIIIALHIIVYILKSNTIS